MRDLQILLAYLSCLTLVTADFEPGQHLQGEGCKASAVQFTCFLKSDKSDILQWLQMFTSTLWTARSV